MAIWFLHIAALLFFWPALFLTIGIHILKNSK